jgi:hypothetical protein
MKYYGLGVSLNALTSPYVIIDGMKISEPNTTLKLFLIPPKTDGKDREGDKAALQGDSLL